MKSLAKIITTVIVVVIAALAIWGWLLEHPGLAGVLRERHTESRQAINA